MLDFIDRFADPRYRADQQLRCASIWVGSATSKKALNAYLSPGSPENGQFVRDAGDDWYDHDFLDAEKQPSLRPATEVIAELGQSHHLPAEVTSRLIEASRERGLSEANAWIVLTQHAYEGDETIDFHGFTFLATFEYQAPPPPRTAQRSHLFAGVTTLSTGADVGAYVFDGAFAADVGAKLDDGEFYHDPQEGDPLPVRDFFNQPMVRNMIILDRSIEDVERVCREHGLDAINAFISGTTDAALDFAPNQRFAGLHYLGVFTSEYIF